MGYNTPLVLPLASSLNSTENVLKAAFINFPPFGTVKRNGDQVALTGPLRVFLDAFAALVGRRIAVGFGGDMVYGARLKDGNFTGVMGLIQRGEADIFLGPAIMTEERFELAEALTLDITSYRLVTWQPSKAIDPFNFVNVFTIDVWICILVIMFLLAVICWFMERFLTPWSEDPKAPLSHFLWDIPTRLFPQDPPHQNDAWFRFCLCGFLLGFSLVLMNFLNSQLTSTMTIKNDEDFINKYEDVLRFPKVRIYSEANSSLSQMFTDPKNEIFRKLSKRLKQKRGIFSQGPAVMEMMSEVEAKKRVITCNPEMCEALIITFMKKNGKCPKVMTTTESSGNMVGSLFVSLKLPRPLRGIIRTYTVRESYIYKKMLLFTTFAAEKCQKVKGASSAEDTKPLVLQDLQGCFILLAIGLSVSIIASIIETFNWKHRIGKNAKENHSSESPSSPSDASSSGNDSKTKIETGAKAGFSNVVFQLAALRMPLARISAMARGKIPSRFIKR